MITDLKAGTMQSIEPWDGIDRIYEEDKQMWTDISAYFYVKSTDLISIIPYKFNKFSILKKHKKKLNLFANRG